MVLKIALRNIMRQKRRTVLSSITIAAGISVFILMNSMISGMDQGMVDNMVHLSTGALRISTKAYDENRQTLPLNYGINNFNEIWDTLLNDKRVSGVTSRTMFTGQLSNYSEVFPVVCTIVNSISDRSVYELQNHIRGSWFSNQSDREIILGKEIAGNLGVKEGDYITLYALTKYDSRNADEFLIKGVIDSPDPSINKNGCFITYKAANDFLDLEGLITEIDIALVDRMSQKAFIKDVNGLENQLKKQFPELSVNSFTEIGAAFFQVSKTKEMFGFVFMVIILLIAAVGIFNTVFMSVYERIREIGVLRAHGMTTSDINLLFLLEGIITGIIGSVMGIITGAVLNFFLVVNGIPLEKMAGKIDTGQYPVWGTIHGVWNFDIFAFVFIFAILVAALASIIPARAAARLQVTRALRFN
jgi:ABC-type lipoprotein release transport system permease subunit